MGFTTVGLMTLGNSLNTWPPSFSEYEFSTKQLCLNWDGICESIFGKAKSYAALEM